MLTRTGIAVNFGEFETEGESPYREVEKRMRRLREAKGLSRRNLADALRVNVTSLVGWEGGIRLPRDGIRKRLTHLLDTNIESWFAAASKAQEAVEYLFPLDSPDTAK